MLITKNDIELRNLQEQVLKNKEDIAKHYEIDRTLSNFGIKIVGTVATVNDLPNPLYYEGEYGDGYAVGQPGSYTYYIFTRPDLNAGITENHWLDVGQLAIQGPEGPVGPEGPQGPRGEATRWYTSSAEAANALPGDLWLDKHGGVYKKSTEENIWTSVTNIKGPQGIQGPRGLQGEQGPQGEKGERGETGDVGAFIHINGILSSSSQLPLPTQINDLSAAYLIGANEPYTLWVQAGSSVQTAIWTDVGQLNVGTYVTSGGQFQNIWNADTKLDRNTSVTQYNQLYAKAADGGKVYIDVTKQAIRDAVVQRESDGSITVTQTPANPYQAANKKYVDTGLDGKVDKVTDAYRIYGTGESGNQIVYPTGWSASSGLFQIMDHTPNGGYNDNGSFNGYLNGTYMVAIPYKPSHATPKKWVEDNFTVYKHVVSIEDGDTGSIPVQYLTFYSTSATPIADENNIPQGIFFGGGANGVAYIYINNGDVINQYILDTTITHSYYSLNSILNVYVYDVVTKL